MDNETPVWKWAVAAIGVIIVCFFLGYFVLGPRRTPGSDTGTQVAQGTASASTPSSDVTVTPRPAPAPGGDVTITEKTAEIEAKRQKAEEARRKKAEEDEKKRREEMRKQDADEPGGAAPTPGLVNGRPDSDDLPTPTDDNTPPRTAPTVIAPSPGPGISTIKPKETIPTPAPAISPIPSPGNNSGGGESSGGGGGGNNTAPVPAVLPEKPTDSATATLYRVRVGSFDRRENAQSRAQELMGRGFAVSTLPEQVGGKMIYHVQAGAFRDEKRAKEVQKELRANGYIALISKG